MANNIILSGGWGFGNLGDDAICQSSVKLIHAKYPNANIIIESFDVNGLLPLFQKTKYVTIEESIYKKIYKEYNPIEESFFLQSKSKQLKQRITRLMNKHLFGCHNNPTNEIKYVKKVLADTESYIGQHKTELEDFKKTCKKSDLYVMSGGHYINNWVQSLVSKYIEVYIAKIYKVKCILIGQSIGTFNSQCYTEMAKTILSSMDKIVFRDTFSLKEAEKMGIGNKFPVLPDIALSEEHPCPKGKYIIYIPFKLSDKKLIIFCQNLKELSLQYNSAPIKIITTQLWLGQLISTSKLFVTLRQYGVDARIVIPNNVYELQTELADSFLVLSENLHGLILSYRANKNIVCLNTNRKFITFMEQIHSSAIDDINNVSDNYFLLNLAHKSFIEQNGKTHRLNFEEVFSQYYKELP